MHVDCTNQLNPSAEVTPYTPCEIYVITDLRERQDMAWIKLAHHSDKCWGFMKVLNPQMSAIS